MWTASQLVRDCAYRHQLSKIGEHKARDAAAVLGKTFHRHVEHWIKGWADHWDITSEPRQWFEHLQATWRPPPGCESEVALGLSPEGRYVTVIEDPPGSHKYRCPMPGVHPLLTAGRADLVWMGPMKVVCVADLKTGRSALGEPGQLLQLLALGFAAADRANATSMKLGIYYARDGVWEWSDPIGLDSDEGADLWDQVETAANLDDSPRPGMHCISCFERRRCAYVSTESHPSL